MATVKQLLDDLLSGKTTLDKVAQEFAKRDWPKVKKASDAQIWGEADDDAPDDDSWATVNACSGLTAEQYATLSAAASATT